jgi:(1->4)-alpha-D-glucan 1-alpha-D-glucosylmutase
MAYSYENRYLVDLFEQGEHSRFRNFFDIDWHHPDENIRGRVHAPVLGELFGTVLEKGHIRLAYDQDGFSINYWEHRFPLRLETYARVLRRGAERLEEELGRRDPRHVRFLGVLYILGGLADETDPDRRGDLSGFVKEMLWELYDNEPVVERFINENIESFNGQAGIPESFKSLEELLWKQVYRLSFWRVASEEINYRRFFSVNDLICVRQEESAVFERTHELVFRLIDEGLVDGIRIDHIDGLYDPTGYLRALRDRIPETPVFVEKILDIEEELPYIWPVDGTTGYEFLNELNAVFVDPAGEKRMRSFYATFADFRADYQQTLWDKKRLIIANHMAGDVQNLARYIRRAMGHYRHGMDITFNGLMRALMEMMIHFPVYRSYIDESVLRAEDREYVRETVKRCKTNVPSLSYEFDYIESILLREGNGESESTAVDAQRFEANVEREWKDVVLRFQQFTGPLMAKGFEDTFMYAYNCLTSLNEVGGDPARFGSTPEQFHAFVEQRRTRHPHAMNASSTHDTKRSEDVRARLNVLSEIPREWAELARQWRSTNRGKKPRHARKRYPDGNDEYLLYQTLVGTWPIAGEYASDDERTVSPGREYRDRIADYLIKAVREAKVHTAWIRPDEAYESAFVSFLDSCLGDREFTESISAFAEGIAFHGRLNGLAQTVVKATAPGFPDIYQGTELEDLSLVDPDNRRAVDYAKRAKLLADLGTRQEDDPRPVTSEDLLSGRAKLAVLSRILGFRRENNPLFLYGSYEPLKIRGNKHRHVLAFLRRHGGQSLLVLVPRLTVGLVSPPDMPVGDVWGETELILPEDAPRQYRDLLGGRRSASAGLLEDGRAKIKAVLADHPVSVLLAD